MIELGITHVMWDFPRPDYPSDDIINAIRKFISLAHTNKLHYIGMYHGGIYNNVDDIINTVIEKVLSLAGFNFDKFIWGNH